MERHLPSSRRAPRVASCLRRELRACLPLLLACLLLGAALPATAQSGPPFVVYQPLSVAIGGREPVFGVETTSLSPERGLAGLGPLGVSWVRRNALRWDDVEPVAGGGYRWDAPRVQGLEQEMINASAQNLRLILIVHGSPRWATAPYQADCAPINAQHYDAFAAFLAAAVRRYSQPPFNVRFWEIGNEPDAYVFATDSVYGCWGLTEDDLYGGREYGAMLKVVYPAMKAANPAIQVLNGGLLLDRPYDAASDTGRSARFLEGVFAVGADAAFDILAFHSYSYYNGSAGGEDGSTDWKVPYLLELMRRYNVTKPLFNTESALLCSTPGEGCRQAQANVIGRFFARAMRDNLMGFIWYIYDSDGFRNTALVEPGNPTIPRPAYAAYRHAATMLGGAAYVGTIDALPPGIEGYTFRRGNQVVMMLWSDTARDIRLIVPTTADVSCSDRDGAALLCMNVGGTVGLLVEPGPRYITYGI